MVTCPKHTFFRILTLEHIKDTSDSFKYYRSIADLGMIMSHYYYKNKKELIKQGINYEDDQNIDPDNQISSIEKAIEELNIPPVEHTRVIDEEKKEVEIFFEDHEKPYLVKSAKRVLKFVNVMRDCLKPSDEAVDRSFEFSRPSVDRKE